MPKYQLKSTITDMLNKGYKLENEFFKEIPGGQYGSTCDTHILIFVLDDTINNITE